MLSPLNRQDQLDELLFEYTEFQQFAGLKINYNKTEVMRMGSIKFTNAQLYSMFPLHWSDGPIRILGVDIFPTWQETIQKNFDEIITKVKNTFSSWKFRSLTPIGKIQIINALTNSQLIYKLQVLPSPGAAFEINYKKLVVEFIWEKKRPKISYSKTNCIICKWWTAINRHFFDE